jgi:hypothetical protein
MSLWIWVKKSYRGGSHEAHLFFEKDLDPEEVNTRAQEWGEHTHGGFEEGYRLEWTAVDNPPPNAVVKSISDERAFQKRCRKSIADSQQRVLALEVQLRNASKG